MFDIIIPTYNNIEELKKCLQGFCKQTFTDFRIMLCIDGNPHNINNFLMKNSFPVHIIPLQHIDEKRHGRSATRNLALESIKAEYLLLFDSDIIPSPELVERHYGLLTNQDCISLGEVEHINLKTNYLADYIQSRGKNRYKDQEVLPAKYITSQNVAIRSKYFIQMGGQDSALVSYGSDIEFGYRLKKSFLVPFIYNKKAVGYTTWDKDLDCVLEQMEEFGKYSLHYIKQKHPEFKEAFRFDLMIQKNLKSFLIRMLMQKPIAGFFKKIVPHVPGFLQRAIMHYLFFFYINKGFRSGG